MMMAFMIELAVPAGAAAGSGTRSAAAIDGRDEGFRGGFGGGFRARRGVRDAPRAPSRGSLCARDLVVERKHRSVGDRRLRDEPRGPRAGLASLSREPRPCARGRARLAKGGRRAPRRRRGAGTAHSPSSIFLYSYGRPPALKM